MRKIAVDNIKGKEILAKPILNDNEVLLIPEGTVLKREFKQVLRDLGVVLITVEDNIYVGVDYDNLVNEETKEDCHTFLQTIIKNQTQGADPEDIEIGKIAEDIIKDVIEQEEVMININKIRRSDNYAFEHAINVSALSVLLALKMNVARHVVKEYAKGALLHDIGMTLIPIRYGQTTNVRLKNNDLNVIKKHVIYGFDYLKEKGFVSNEALNIVINHHERLDGSGYPKGLIGTNIDMGSRIVSVCDTFDGMVYGFADKSRVHEAIEYIQGNSGNIFDENVVSIFLDSVALYPTGSIVITNSGETAMIHKQNKGFPARPILRMIKDAEGETYAGYVIIDLLTELNTFVIDTVSSI